MAFSVVSFQTTHNTTGFVTLCIRFWKAQKEKPGTDWFYFQTDSSGYRSPWRCGYETAVDTVLSLKSKIEQFTVKPQLPQPHTERHEPTSSLSHLGDLSGPIYSDRKPISRLLSESFGGSRKAQLVVRDKIQTFLGLSFLL